MGRYDFNYPTAGDPHDPTSSSSVQAAIGETVVWFQELEEQLATAISFLLHGGDQAGQIVTSEISFRAKVNLWSSLMAHEGPESSRLDELHDLAKACLQIEEKRNQIVHSRWLNTIDGTAMIRMKYTARGKHGLKEQAEVLTPSQVDAVWAHCGYLAHLVDEFMYAEFGVEYSDS